jgi:hypothetical protein
MISTASEHEKRRQAMDRARRKREREEAERLYAIVRKIVSKRQDETDISPSWVATEAWNKLIRTAKAELGSVDLRIILPEIYIAAHLQMRQITREICRKMYEDDDDEADDERTDTQHEMFPGLQRRYPVAKHGGDEPVYRKLEELSDADYQYNIDRLAAEAATKTRHKDALKAHWEEVKAARASAL